MPKAILAVGLVLPSSPASTTIQAAVANALKTANDSGYHAEIYVIDTSDPHHLESFRDLLKGRTWDAVMIGWGIRGASEHTALFERLVNSVVEEMKPTPKFIFSLKPEGFVDAIQRVFGEV